jgi:hypothetical protein
MNAAPTVQVLQAKHTPHLRKVVLKDQEIPRNHLATVIREISEQNPGSSYTMDLTFILKKFAKKINEDRYKLRAYCATYGYKAFPIAEDLII